MTRPGTFSSHDRPSWPSRIATWIVCTVLGAGFGVLVMLWMAGVG